MDTNAGRPSIVGEVGPRTVVFRTRGSKHGPIARLISPADVGEMVKPFVFLDFVNAPAGNMPRFNWHPHSGIATLTLLLEGSALYEETTGVKGTLTAGAIEWMCAGGGVWHTGRPVENEAVKAFQLWVALPPDLENVPAQSCYLNADEVPKEGPARVVLGRYGTATSRIPAPGEMTYLDVRLRDGERWTYVPPNAHTLAWIAMHEGSLLLPELIGPGELAVFAESNDSISFQARGDTGFVLGSAVKHPYPLVTGYYLVHTNRDALLRGEAEIDRQSAIYRSQGILPHVR